jgi:hypothetical protein
MSPSSEPRNPRHMAAVTVVTARFHDVVVSASKLVHGARLEQRDVRALEWAQEMLNVASETDVVFDMPSSTQLATVGAPVLALKEAAAASNESEALSNVRDQLEAALQGKRNQLVIDHMIILQQLFSTVTRIALKSEVQTKTEREADQTWALSTTILHS